MFQKQSKKGGNMSEIQKKIDSMEQLAGEFQFYQNQYVIIKNNIENFENQIKQMRFDLGFIKQNLENCHREFKKFVKNLE